jgi:hypothetical protein
MNNSPGMRDSQIKAFLYCCDKFVHESKESVRIAAKLKEKNND